MNGKNMRMARVAKSVSLTDLSKAVGISASQLSRFESNLRKPHVEELQRIAKALGVQAGDLAPDFGGVTIKPIAPAKKPSLPPDIEEKLADISKQDRRNPEQELEWLIEQEWLKRNPQSPK